MVLTDPHPTLAGYRSVCQDVLEAGEHQEQLIEALLTLARSQRGLDRRDHLDLAAITRGALDARQAQTAAGAWPSPPPSAQRRLSPGMPGCWSGWRPT